MNESRGVTLLAGSLGWLLHLPFYLIGLSEAWGAAKWDLSDMETWDRYQRRVSARSAASVGH